MTQATHYGYFVVRPGGDYDIYTIPTSDILQMIMDRRYSRDMKGGDGGRSQFFLFDKNIFEQYKVNGLSAVEDSAHGILLVENLPLGETSSSPVSA